MGLLNGRLVPAAEGAATFALRCGALRDPRALAFVGHEALGRCFDYHVYFTLDDEVARETRLDDVIGAQAVLTLHRDPRDVHDARATHVSGRVVEIEQVDDDACSLHRLRLVPALWLLGHSSHHRVFVGRTIPEILREILAGPGLEPESFTLRLSAQYARHDHVCQYAESDLSFVQRCMEREGIHYYFDATGEDSRLVITDGGPPPVLPGAQPAAYRPWARGEPLHGDAVHAFRSSHAALPRDATSADYDYLTPDVAVREASPVADDTNARVVLWDDGEASVHGARRAAQLEAERLRCGAHRCVAESTALPMHVGYAFSLQEHPITALNRQYLAVRVDRHACLGPGGPLDTILARAHGVSVARDGHGVRVEAIASDVPFRPERATPRPMVPGLELAVVDGPADGAYAQLDAQGRTLVRFRMDENDSADGRASTWLRRLQPHGGAPEGWHLPLRKGTEVLVGFVGGDPDRPVIVGVAPDARTPSVVTASNSTRNVLQTSARARLEIEDRDGAQYVDLSTPEQSSTLHLGAHGGLGDHNVVVSTRGDGLIDTGGNRDMVVGGDSSTVVQGALTERYGASQTRAVAAAFLLAVDGPATETIDGGFTQTVTGGLAQSITGGETRSVTGPTTQTVVGSHTLLVDGASTETVGGIHAQTVAGGASIRSAGPYSVSADGSVALTTRGPMNMLANTWHMNAPGGQLNMDSWLSHVMTYFAQSYDQLYVNIHGAYLNMAGVNVEVGGARLDVVGVKLEQNGVVISLAGVKQHKVAAGASVGFGCLIVAGFTAFI